MAKMAALRAK